MSWWALWTNKSASTESLEMELFRGGGILGSTLCVKFGHVMPKGKVA